MDLKQTYIEVGVVIFMLKLWHQTLAYEKQTFQYGLHVIRYSNKNYCLQTLSHCHKVQCTFPLYNNKSSLVVF